MAKILLAILAVLVLSRMLPQPPPGRGYGWLERLWAWWDRSLPPALRSGWGVLVLPALLVVLCGWLQHALERPLLGLPALVLAIAVLWHAWGPRDLDADVDAVLKAPDGERRLAAAQALRTESQQTPLALESASVVEAAFASALSRWFGVLFWFVVLGPAGALGYRIVQQLARGRAFANALDAGQRATFEKAALALDWAPAHLVALTLALVSDFDAVLKTWRDYHAGKGYFTLDLGFLGVLARAGVDADVIAGDGYATDVNDALGELGEAHTVLRRILIAWIALVALLVVTTNAY